MKKLLLLSFLFMPNISAMSEQISIVNKIKQFATTLSENIISLNKDIRDLVQDTGQAYSGATKSFGNINEYASRIKKEELFGKIDTALKLMEKQMMLVNNLVNLLYSTSKAVVTSSQLIKPFSPGISESGEKVAQNIEKLAWQIMSTGLTTVEIIKPLRKAMKQITAALTLLNREINPSLKKSLPLDQSQLLDEAAEAQEEFEKSEKEFEKELEEWEMIPHHG